MSEELNIITMPREERRFSYILDEDYELAEKNGICRSTVYSRVFKMGMDIDTAIRKKVRKQGDHTEAWKRWEDIANVSRHIFVQRLGLGWSEVRAALRPKVPNNSKYRGRKGKLYTEEDVKRAEAKGISKQLFQRRVNFHKMSVEEAINTPKRSKKEAGEIRARQRWGIKNGKQQDIK